MGGVFGGPSGQDSEQRFPKATNNVVDLIFENFPGAQGLGLTSQIFAGGGGFGQPSLTNQYLFDRFGEQVPSILNQGFQGGSILRGMAADGTNRAFNNSTGLAGQLMGAGQGTSALLGAQPGFLDAANAFAGRINQGAQQFGPAFQNLGGAFAGANQTLQDALNPTAQNSLFQNALANQVLPQVRAAAAARGLGNSGIGAGLEVEATRDLANQFAMRQQQERLGALGQLNALAGTQGGLAGQLGGLGVASAQVPGAVFNQFMQGQGAGVQNLLGAQQGQLGPLQAAGLGGQVFGQGLQMPLQTFNQVLGTRNVPLTLGINAIGGTAGTFSNPEFRGLFGVPK